MAFYALLPTLWQCRVKLKHEDGTGRIGRWHCKACSGSFKVTHGTLFHGTKIPLQKWFLAIALVLNAKKGLSSYQFQRDLDLNQKTAWYMLTRIRAEMAKKTPVIGAVERGRKVIAEVAENLTGQRILEFIKRAVKIDDSELMTDEFHAYNTIGQQMKHQIVNHQEQYVEGNVHTNTIEDFWSLLKRAWYGNHHHYSTGYTPLYVAERCYVYNRRDLENIFDKFVGEVFQ